MNSIWDWDLRLMRQINVGWHSPWLDPIFFVISSTGLGWVQVIIILACIPWKSLFDRTSPAYRDFRGLMSGKISAAPLFLYSWVFTGTIDTIVKHAVPRDRPSYEPWDLPQEDVHAWSFASGHTAGAFGLAFLAFFLSRGTRFSKWGWAALVWAALVGFSRVYRGVHWPTDVVSGFFVGLGCSCLFMIGLNALRRSRPHRNS
jgi:undecaprenyl-diphosphatase